MNQHEVAERCLRQVHDRTHPAPRSSQHSIRFQTWKLSNFQFDGEVPEPVTRNLLMRKY